MSRYQNESPLFVNLFWITLTIVLVVVFAAIISGGYAN